jgi:WD40 repeat protein
VAFTTNGNLVLTAQADHRSAVLWRTTNQAIHRAFTVTLATVPGLSDAAVAPDASRVATCDRGADAVRVWDVGSGRQLMVLVGHPLGAVAAAFSPDGMKLLTGGNPVASVSTVRVWDLTTWQTLFSLNHQSAVTSVSFCSDGSKILTVDRERQTGEGMALFWNATTGARIRSLAHGNVQVLAAASAPDDSTIVTGAADGQARRFDAATGQLLQVFHLGTNDSAIPAVAFSPDGTRILTAHADGSVAVWSLAAAPAVSLSIDREQSGQLVVTWPTGPDTMGAVLQRCLDLNDKRWTIVTPSQPGRYEVAPLPGASCFFRLLLSQ